MSTREICFPIRTILGYRYSCIDKIRYPGEEEVSIYRRGFSPFISQNSPTFWRSNDDVSYYANTLLMNWKRGYANRFINLREPSPSREREILFVFRGWSIPVRVVTADTGFLPPLRVEGKFAAEVKLAPRFRNRFREEEEEDRWPAEICLAARMKINSWIASRGGKRKKGLIKRIWRHEIQYAIRSKTGLISANYSVNNEIQLTIQQQKRAYKI